MYGISAGILRCKDVQIGADLQRTRRLLIALERQAVQQRKVVSSMHLRFEEIKKTVCSKESRIEAGKQSVAAVEELLREARKIKSTQQRLATSLGTLASRKETHGKDFGVLKDRAELVDRALKDLKLRKDRAEDLAENEYRSAVVKFFDAGAAEGTIQVRTCASETNQLRRDVYPDNPSESKMRQQLGSGAGRSALTSETLMSDSEKGSAVSLIYRAQDGSLFNLGLAAQAGKMRIFVLAEYERDRRMLLREKSRLEEELLSRGLRINTLKILRAGGSPGQSLPIQKESA